MVIPNKIGQEKFLKEENYLCTFEGHISWPRITIVTPSYNQGPFIETTIRSLLLQGYPNLQYIIVDGGSTDNTLEVIRHYEAHISHWISEKDRGQSHAINKGIALADGEIFNWINSDDWLEPGALKHVALLFMEKQAQAVATRCNIIKGGTLAWVNGATSKSDDFLDSALVTGLNQQGLYFRTECIRRLNGVDETFDYSMDLDLWVRFLLTFGQDKFVTSEYITADFRFHDASKSEVEGWGPGSASDRETKAMRMRTSGILKNEKTLKSLRYLYPDFRPDIAHLPPHSPLDTELVGRWINRHLFLLARKAFYAEDFLSTLRITEGIDTRYLPPDQAKDAWAFQKYARLFTSFAGPLLKRIFSK